MNKKPSKDDGNKQGSKSDARRRSISSNTREPSGNDVNNGFDVIPVSRRESSDPGKKQILQNYITDSRRSNEDAQEINIIGSEKAPSQQNEHVSGTDDRVKFDRDDVENNNVYNYRPNESVQKDKPSNSRNNGLDRSNGAGSDRRKSEDYQYQYSSYQRIPNDREPPYPRRYLVREGDLPPFMPRLTGYQRNPLYPVAIATVDLPSRKALGIERDQYRDGRSNRSVRRLSGDNNRRRSMDRERRKSKDIDDHGRYHKDRPERRRYDDDRDDSDDDRGHHSSRRKGASSHNHGLRRSEDKRGHSSRHRSKDNKGHSSHHRKHDADIPPDEASTQVTQKAAEEKKNETRDIVTLYNRQGAEDNKSSTGMSVDPTKGYRMQRRLRTRRRKPRLRKSSKDDKQQMQESGDYQTVDKRPNLQDEQTTENIARYFAQNHPQIIMAVQVTKDKTELSLPQSKSVKFHSKNKSTNPSVDPKNSRKRRLHDHNVTEVNLAKKLRDLQLQSKPKTAKKTESKKKTKKPSKPPPLDITDFDSYYNYVYDQEFVEPSDREDEWLELSTTDYGSEKMKIKSFEKELNPWMLEGISYESQNLVREMRIFDILCWIAGRKFYFNVPNFFKGHIDFIVKRTNQIPFFISTFILWNALVLSLQSFADIETDSSGSDTVQIEKLEIQKYHLFLIYVMANLLLSSVWSLIVVLKDCHIIAHYFNCWCAALADMETTGAIDIKKVTLSNVTAWFVAAVILIVAFVFDFPESVRGTSGVVSILLFRGLIADIRLRNDEDYLPFQITGLVFILYVMFCSRLLFCLMQILSLIIKNSAEMWNFKFALTFDQLTLSNRGQMMQIKLNFPLVKIFSQHRVITALLKIYGEIFAVPVSIYIVMQMTVFTVVLIFLFNYSQPTPEDYDGKTKVIYEFRDVTNQTLRHLEIDYYNSRAAVFTTAICVLIQVLFDFLYTTEIITNASRAFFDGFEFVRRTSLILCQNSHQRRVIQSLLWSMSSTDASLLTAANYYSLTKQTIASALSTALVFFSLIIQLRRKKEFNTIDIDDCSEGSPAEHQDRCAGAIDKFKRDPDEDLYILKLNP